MESKNNVKLYANMFSQAREQENDKLKSAMEAKNKRVERLKALANNFIEDIQEIYDIICSAYDNGYIFCEGDNIVDAGRTKNLPNCIGYAFTDGINHRLGFYNPNCKLFSNGKPSFLKIGYAGGGCAGHNVTATIIGNTLNWSFGTHDPERYLSDFVDEFPKFKKQFYADIEKKFGSIK